MPGVVENEGICLAGVGIAHALFHTTRVAWSKYHDLRLRERRIGSLVMKRLVGTIFWDFREPLQQNRVKALAWCCSNFVRELRWE